jgi:hypothetical protein
MRQFVFAFAPPQFQVGERMMDMDSMFQGAGGGSLDEPGEVSAALATFVPSTSACPVLHQFRPAWAPQAYLRFAGIRYHVQNRCFPECPARLGLLPALADGHFLVPAHDTVAHLAREHKNLDAGLSESELADSHAFATMVTSRLAAALAYYRWADNDGYEKRTLPEMRRVVPLPFRWYMLGALRSKQLATLRAAGHGTSSGAVDRKAAEDMARECYRALNARLGASVGGSGGGGGGDGAAFFFRDDAPTTLDALVFGHVTDALADLSLGKIVRGYAHLIAHFERVRDRYFAQEAGGGGDGGGDGSSSSSSSSSSRSVCTMNTQNAFNCLGSKEITLAGGGLWHGVSDYAGAVGPAPEPVGGTVGHGGGGAAAPPSEFVRQPPAPPKVKKEPTEDERAMAEGSRNFMLFAGASIVSYLLWGDVISIEFDEGDAE